jgi:hypothetical protein
MKKVTMTAYDERRGFSIKNLGGGYTLSIGVGKHHYCENGFNNTSGGETSTMEVAIMDKNGRFVCLPDDVAGHVPVSKLNHLITAINVHDWHQVCWLCDEDAEPTKFPKEEVA